MRKRVMMVFLVRVILLSSIWPLVFSAAFFFCGFTLKGWYLLYCFFNIPMSSWLLAITLRRKAFYTSPLIPTNTDITPSASANSSSSWFYLFYDLIFAFLFFFHPIYYGIKIAEFFILFLIKLNLRRLMAFTVRLMLLSSIWPLVFSAAFFFCGFTLKRWYLLYCFSTVPILAIKLRPKTLLHTTSPPSVTTNKGVIPSSSDLGFVSFAFFYPIWFGVSMSKLFILILRRVILRRVMDFTVRLMLLYSVCPLVFFSAFFFFGFISLRSYLLFFFSTVSICSCLLAFNFHYKRRLLIYTSSVTTNKEVILSSSSSYSSSLLSSSSSPSPSPPSGKLTYDVFLSFRGSDTRNNFTDHLYTVLKQKGIYTFRDDEELKRGESIGPNLLKAIEESRYVIAIFSRNYADSSWCLDEIAKVADCMKAMGQKVLPVFYHVDPSEVRRQTGDHFGEAFQKHQQRFEANPSKVQRWKDALFQVGNLSGWHLQDGSESKVIQEIAGKIFTELNQLIPISEGLVGMDPHLNETLSYLDIGCPDVRIIGICGMGGIGKSTIAHVVFERVKTQFEGDSFLENVRELNEKQGAVHLQQQLLLNLLKCSVNVQTTRMGKDIIRHRLCSKRVLLVLDDVDQEEQLEALCDRTWFGPGSRIILTSRDEHLLTAFGVDRVYKVNPLSAAEALELFRMKAFKKDQPVGEDFLELSEEFLKYASGLPLAIKVLGSSVHGKSLKLWSSALGRLRNNPNKKIINVLKVSFDGLEETEKKIFLDIACFFKGEHIDDVKSVLQGGDYSPDIDIEVLVEKSLVTLFGKKLEMHDLVQELGWEIVRQECPEQPEKRSRLWLPNEIIHVLSRSKVMSAVQSINLRCPTGDDVVHSIYNAFSNMDKLRLLKICNVKASGNITYLSNELQYLEWHECPLYYFPSNFQPEKLVQVHMKYSNIKQLWRGEKGWSMLRLLDLTGSQYLISTPDFTKVPDLEKLVLLDCTSLVKVHASLGFLKKLRHLDMKNCKSIKSIPPFHTLESLQTLILSGCSGLKTFPEIAAPNMKSLLQLHLDETDIKGLPPSIERLTDLTILNLTDCKNLLHLPDTIGCLTSLKSLHLTGCSKLGMKLHPASIRELSFIAGMKNLRYLSCQGCKCLVSESCKGLVSSLSASLLELDLSYCNLMDGAFLNDLSSCLTSSLAVLNLSGNCFVQLPESISQFSKLVTLKLSNCRQLQSLPKKLPLCLKYVYAENCTSLTDYPNQIKVLTSLEHGEVRVTIVNSLDSPDSSALAEIGRSHSKKGEGFVELHSTHKYTDGKQVDHYMTLPDFLAGTGVNNMFTSSCIVPTDEIPEWFGTTISTSNSISIPIPANLTDDNKWKGFAACAIFSLKGHTALSFLNEPADFSNYWYQLTLETDNGRLEPYVLPMREANSTSHLLVIFYLSNWKNVVPQLGLDQSSVVRAIFETTHPSIVVQKCAIRLVYDERLAWYFTIFPESELICLTGVEDPDELETAWLTKSGKWEILIPPL